MPIHDDATKIRPYGDFCVWGIIAAFAFGWWKAGLINEGGALELATVIALVLTFGLFILRLPSLAMGPEWHLPALTLLFVLRELDFDKRFMEVGVLKLRLYSGDAPLVLKFIGAMVIAIVLICLYRVVRHNGRAFLVALRAREGWAITIALGFVSGVVAKSVDGLGRKLAPFGVELSEAQGLFTIFVEEFLELGFATALLISLFLWIRGYA
ncbi:hypothetical protein SAMN05444004_102118 [Jannaschia faecimaris]|uniref:Uncharacterized protein n=1 Tax=Jannaschia faecimaris TaxID=1244108 RepID=A0A1H3L845_9RHOB|nr:hypothetical protein [Jannaschia faecimaris]SDY60561.1 hypothetical protein SAMN05444004_102118 [Jannaschia faecimaris]